MSEELFVLPVPFATYVELRQFLPKHGIAQDLHEVVDRAIKDWMAALEASSEAATSCTLKGFQWKSLFLPDGTKLRAVCDGEHHVAHVVGGKVVYEGRIYSPPQFVNHVHGSTRNAWKSIWLLFPNETDWHLANEYRGMPSEIRERISINKKKKNEQARLRKNPESTLGISDGLTQRDSLLHIAAQLNDLDTMQQLLSEGQDPNAKGELGATPMHYAWSDEAKSLLHSFGGLAGIKDDLGRLPGEEPDFSG